MPATVEPSTIEALEPQGVWRLFAGMSKVPRPSKQEERIRAHVRALAETMGFAVREDRQGNLAIDVPGTAGFENAPITTIQGHLDMVCEANAGTKHDFDNDPIRLIVDTDPEDGEPIVRADGTTLGADNAVGVAMGLAAAADPQVVHGPLELLCTMDEEAGMSGAKALTADFVKGRRMLNLDAEEDDKIYIGCAGGSDTTLTWLFEPAPTPKGAALVRMTVNGLIGGHSGGDIHIGRGNAIKLLARTLGVAELEGACIVEMGGGRLRNALPREAHAIVAIPSASKDRLTEAALRVRDEARSDHGESGCRIDVAAADASEGPTGLSAADSLRLIRALTALPHGVLGVVPEIPGLVRTSNNVANLRLEGTDGGARVVVGCLTRSSSPVQMDVALRQIAAIGAATGARAQRGNAYPGWAPDLSSPTLATCREVYARLFGEAPDVTAIHAGLECGIIGERVPGMDMVSFGPRIEGAHSPDERVYVRSVQKSWRMLTGVLEALARG